MPNRIKEIRKQKKFTRERLAAQVGMSPRMLQYIEEGERELTQKWMELIAKALGIPSADLIEDPKKRDNSKGRFLALLTVDQILNEPTEIVKSKLIEMLDQQLQALEIGMTPESFVNFVVESRKMAAQPPPETQVSPKKK